jgi:transcriptional regulator with XRE-family HTH domain
MATFAERLATILKDRGWKKTTMYQTMQIAPGTLSQYLSGKNSPNIDAVRAYAFRLGVSVGWLAGVDPDKEDVAKARYLLEYSGDALCQIYKILDRINSVYLVEAIPFVDMAALVSIGDEPKDETDDPSQIYERKFEDFRNPKLFCTWMGVVGEFVRMTNMLDHNYKEAQ